ncbi:MAG: hypothetical protein R3C09_02050 [Pirellulaceae bacterium]
MTQPTINPYEPTSHTAAAPLPSEPLKFNGTIERSDYQDMLPRDQEWWLIVVLAVLLGIIFLVLAPVSVLLAISKGKVVDAIVLLGFCVLILVALGSASRSSPPAIFSPLHECPLATSHRKQIAQTALC